jgi:hypothetical protein
MDGMDVVKPPESGAICISLQKPIYLRNWE